MTTAFIRSLRNGISHVHNGHFGGAAYLQENFGARIVTSERNWAHMRVWPQREPLAPFPRDDIAVRDGNTAGSRVIAGAWL